MFTRSNSDRLHLLAALILTTITLVGDDWRWPVFGAVRDTVYAGFEPVFTGIAWPGNIIDTISDSLSFGETLRAENVRLKQQNLILSAKVQKLSYLVNDNARLRGLIDSSQQINGRVLVGEVIGIDPDPSRHVLIINQGQQDGLFVGQPILDARGVVGRVIQAGRQTSRVMLISDRQHSVPVRINRNGLRAILSGTGEDMELRLQFVPQKSDIKPGDLLVTSGLGKDFPAGYPVARVSRIRQLSDDQFLEITAVPVALLDRSRYVMALFESVQGAASPQPTSLLPQAGSAAARAATTPAHIDASEPADASTIAAPAAVVTPPILAVPKAAPASAPVSGSVPKAVAPVAAPSTVPARTTAAAPAKTPTANTATTGVRHVTIP